MKTTTILIFVVTSVLFVSRADTGAQSAIINWQGNGGYRATISMNYDASFALVSAQGGGPFGGLPTNQPRNQFVIRRVLFTVFLNPGVFDAEYLKQHCDL